MVFQMFRASFQNPSGSRLAICRPLKYVTAGWPPDFGVAL